MTQILLIVPVVLAALVAVYGAGFAASWLLNVFRTMADIG